jgi:cytochrome P450
MAVLAPESVDLAKVDLSDPAWFTDGPPHELFARMRREAPIHRNEPGNPVVPWFWNVTRAADIEHVSKDTEKIFSSYEKGVFIRDDAVGPLELMRNLVLFKDPPEHSRFRKLLLVAFTPRVVAVLEDSVRARVRAILDRVGPTGRMDVVTDLSVPIPLAVIADLLGAPQSDVDLLEEWTARIEVGQREPETGEGLAAFFEMGQYLTELISGQLDSDRLVGRLARAEIDGDRLSEEELMLFFGILVFAGNDTTRNTTSAGIRTLIDHPDQLRMLREDPSLIPNAIEEMLRYSTVVNHFARTALADTVVGGQEIKAGEKLVLWYTSGSRDETVFPDPHRFDITRRVDMHHAFGGGGRHFCLGAGLARLELKVVFEEFVARITDPRLAAPPVRHASPWINGWEHLPIEFTPTSG